MTLADIAEHFRNHPVHAAVATMGVTAASLWWIARAGTPAPEPPLYANTNLAPATSIVREFEPVRRVVPVPKALEPAVLPPLLQIHVEVPPETNAPTLGVFAPAGRLIKAVTVNTIDSANTLTPIIAMTIDDVWFDGELVIPRGSELHGRANVDRVRDHIVSSGPWTIVLQSGEELVVNAIPLTRDENGNGRWGERDGSAGLTGEVIKNATENEIKLFASTFLSGAAAAFQQTQATLLGTQVLGTARNAALNGTSQVLNNYAQQIAEAIRRDGTFVRVPGGTPMYLYVINTLDRSSAKIGNLRVDAIAPPNDLRIPGTKP